MIDGISTKNLTRENIHELFIMVLQDTWLFDGSIRDNIRFNKENVSDSKIWEALKTVGVDHFVKTLPGGLDAKISDDDSISQGQKQLLTIARGMIEDAPFLILDEATSGLDIISSQIILDFIKKEKQKGKTIIYSTHYMEEAENICDNVFMINKGKVVKVGTPKQIKRDTNTTNLRDAFFALIGGENDEK